MLTAQQFWTWFEDNNLKYFFLNQIDDNDIKENLLDDFLKQLHQYCDQLFFLIGGYPDEEQELIITAEGNKDFFPKVIELTNKAPQIKNWKIIAFKQPQEIDFITRYKTLVINTRELWFLPLENPEAPNDLAVRVGYPNYDSEKQDDFLFVTNLILDSILGEKTFADDIVYVDADDLPLTPEDFGFISLAELPEYIAWFKNNF